MNGYFTTVFLFLAVIVGAVTYFVVPSVPITILAASSAVSLAAVLYWHWTQFSIEYRLSTWQDGLRNYASYILVFLVILFSYGFYVFSINGGSIPEIAKQTQTNIRNVGRNALSRISATMEPVVAAVSTSPAPAPAPAPYQNPMVNIMNTFSANSKAASKSAEF